MSVISKYFYLPVVPFRNGAKDTEKFVWDATQQLLECKAISTSYKWVTAKWLAHHFFLESYAVPDNHLHDG